MPGNDTDELRATLRGAARDGLLCDLAPELRDEDLDAADGACWPPQRRIPADLLRAVLLDPHLHPDPRGLRIRGAFIGGALDLSHATLPCPLALIGSRLQEPATLEHARLRHLDLRGSHLAGLRLDRAVIEGDAVLLGSSATGDVRAIGAHIGGRLILRRATLVGASRDALIVDGARVDGGALLGGLNVSGGVRAVGARIGGELDLLGATLTNDDGDALNLDGARIDGPAFLGGLTATGTVRAVRAHMDSLGLQEATLTSADEDAPSPGEPRVDGSASSDGPSAEARVRAPDGRHALEAPTVSKANRDVLILDGARVDGGAFLGGLNVTGGVRAVAARIGGELDLQGATLTNGGRVALSLDGARIDGPAFLGGLTATGTVRAVRAHMDSLGLQGATLTNRNGDALCLDGARIDGGAFLGALRAKGRVRALGAHIGGRLDLEGAALANAGKDALAAESLQVDTLWLSGIGAVQGRLNLTGARIGDLVVDRERPVAGPPGPLVASGWTVADVHGDLRTDRGAASAWLASQPAPVTQPWHELADVYDRNGQPADARILRFQAAHRATSIAPWFAKPPRWAYALLVGYGYYPLAAGAWLVAALLTASLLTATHMSTFVPSNPAAAARAVAGATAAGTPSVDAVPASPGTAGGSRTVTGATSCARLGDRHPCLRALLYSLDVVLPPTVSTGQASAWRPGVPWLAYLMTGLKAFGWILTALLIAGVTGLLRKT